MKRKVRFDKSFKFGTATAAIQIEGAADADGRGDSVWDSFARFPGHIYKGHTPRTACDHYRRYKDDVKLMKGLGMDSYRFSVSWPRIVPDASGRIEQRGLDFYSKLIDELLENGIEPALTLHHWDMPQWVFDNHAGWLGRDSAKHFADYAETVIKVFSSRVKLWISHNEPKNVTSNLGYLSGDFAPGIVGGLKTHYTCAHNILYSHALAAQRYKEFNVNPEGSFGITLALNKPYILNSAGKEKDELALRRCKDNGIFWLTDPIFKGSYPSTLKEEGLEEFLPYKFEDDYALIKGSSSFLGINTYFPTFINYSKTSRLKHETLAPSMVQGYEKSGFGWPIDSNALYELLTMLDERYPGLEMHITENGYGDDDSGAKSKGDFLNDEARLRYFKSYIAALGDAIDEGVNVKSYYAWSLMDNFEWSSGYSKRFGLFHVDYDTQERTPKLSAKWFKEFLKTREYEL